MAVRHVAQLGPPTALSVLLQAALGWPAAQRGSGGGAGWFVPTQSAPVRYRRAGPLAADASLASVAPTVWTPCALVAAVEGGPYEDSACPPLLLDGVLVSVAGSVAGAAAGLGRLVPAAALAATGTTVDSAFVAALVGARLAAGDPLERAVAAASRLVAERVPGSAHGLLATDGRSLVATACGAALLLARTGRGTRLTSGGGEGEAVPDRRVVVATVDGARVEAL